MQNRKISPKKTTQAFEFEKVFDLFEPLFTFEALIISVVSAATLLIILLCYNHTSSSVKEHVVATVIEREYDAPYDTEDPIYTTDSKGNQILVGYSHTYHPEEWHVTWAYRGLEYRSKTPSNWGGIKIGDPRMMIIRVGGVFKNEYLWYE